METGCIYCNISHADRRRCQSLDESRECIFGDGVPLNNQASVDNTDLITVTLSSGGYTARIRPDTRVGIRKTGLVSEESFPVDDIPIVIRLLQKIATINQLDSTIKD